MTGPAGAARGTGRHWCPGTRPPGCSGSGGGTPPGCPAGPGAGSGCAAGGRRSHLRLVGLLSRTEGLSTAAYSRGKGAFRPTL